MANIFDLRKCRIIVELQLERTKVLLMIGGEILVVNIRCCRCIEVTNAPNRRMMNPLSCRQPGRDVIAIDSIQLREHVSTCLIHCVFIKIITE